MLVKKIILVLMIMFVISISYSMGFQNFEYAKSAELNIDLKVSRNIFSYLYGTEKNFISMSDLIEIEDVDKIEDITIELITKMINDAEHNDENFTKKFANIILVDVYMIPEFDQGEEEEYSFYLQLASFNSKYLTREVVKVFRTKNILYYVRRNQLFRISNINFVESVVNRTLINNVVKKFIADQSIKINDCTFIVDVLIKPYKDTFRSFIQVAAIKKTNSKKIPKQHFQRNKKENFDRSDRYIKVNYLGTDIDTNTRLGF